jgi:hypothetical protein
MKGITQMPIRRWNAPSLRTDADTTHLVRILVTALACQLWGCASASVYNGGQNDGSAGTAADGKDVTGSDEKNAKNDVGTPDSSSWVCDPFTNAGCDSDKKCTALQSSETLSLGCGGKDTKSEGDDCTQTVTNGTQTGDDCGDGLACFSIHGESKCRRICPTSGTANACPTSSVCSLSVSGLTGLAFCQEPCKVLEQEGCQSGEACYALAIGGVCFKAGTTNTGDSCSNAYDCESGSTCITSGSTGVCSSFCSTATDGTPSCSDGKTCKPLPGTLPEDNAGYCI